MLNILQIVRKLLFYGFNIFNNLQYDNCTIKSVVILPGISLECVVRIFQC